MKVQHSYVCFLTLGVLQQAGPSAVRAHARAAQLAEEVLSLKNDTYECWTLIKPTLYWLYMHKYTMFLIWWPFLNLKPTLLFSKVDIWCTYILPLAVNIFCEWPLTLMNVANLRMLEDTVDLRTIEKVALPLKLSLPKFFSIFTTMLTYVKLQ